MPKTLIMRNIVFLMMRTYWKWILCCEIPLSHIWAISLRANPETVISMRISMECHWVTQTLILLYLVFFSPQMLSVVADSFCSEVPVYILKFDLTWVNPEPVLSRWVSMVSRHQIVTFCVTSTLVVIVSNVLIIWTYEMEIIVKLWYHIVI
jgi:hypothetical protein